MDKIANDKEVFVGEVGINKLVFNDNRFKSEQIFNTFDNSLEHHTEGTGDQEKSIDFEDIARETKACYMSKDKFDLAVLLVSEYYNSILSLGMWHSNFVRKIQEKDRGLSKYMNATRK